jgi:hypothetical protein
MTLHDAVPLGIFAVVYLVLTRGNIPPLRLDRAGAALVGAVAIVVSGAVKPAEAEAAISFPTLMLLLGMMIVVANLRLSGAFTLGAGLVLGRARTPRGLLALTVAVAGTLAAVFINDVVCLVLTPLVLDVTATLSLDPVPFLLADIGDMNGLFANGGRTWLLLRPRPPHPRRAKGQKGLRDTPRPTSSASRGRSCARNPGRELRPILDNVVLACGG